MAKVKAVETKLVSMVKTKAKDKAKGKARARMVKGKAKGKETTENMAKVPEMVRVGTAENSR